MGGTARPEAAVAARDIGRYKEIQGDIRRYREIKGGTTCGGAGRREIQGDTGRYREI